MKKVLCFFTALLILSATAFALPSPTKEFYANDFADVLGSDLEEYIVSVSSQLEAETEAQVVVVTVPSLDGMSDSDYALKLGREWGIGGKEKNNGVLLLVSTGDRSLRIEVGYGLEGALPDGKCGRISDEYIIPYLAEDNYSEGILSGYNQIVYEVCSEYGVEVPEGVNAAAMPEEDEGDFIAAVAAVILLIVIFNIYRKIPPSFRGGRRGGMFIGHGSFGRGGFGGFGGGSGGGFSGGGGSFGGGGSSRKF